MVNTEKFSKRLHKILDFYDLSAAAFADQIEVGRSSISHILSGRNKPSLDFVMKVVQTFPEVELYWLLNGKGSFPKSNTEFPVPASPASEPVNPSPGSPKIQREQDLFDKASPSTIKQIEKIVIFYSDGSFEAFKN